MTTDKNVKLEKDFNMLEVEAKFVNRSFDKLFRKEKESRKHSKSAIKECENDDAPSINRDDSDEKDVNVVHHAFYTNILSRARSLLLRKDHKEESEVENALLMKTQLKETLHSLSQTQEKYLEPEKSVLQNDRNVADKSFKTAKENAETLTEEILEIHCVPDRVLPGRTFVVSHSERLVCGLDCDQIFPGVILASGKTVKNFAYLSQLRVTHIINTASRDVWLPVEKLSNLGVEIFQFHVDDVPSANIAPYFTPAAEFVARATQAGGLLVINCLVGLSRSATILTAALMMNNQWTVKRALKKLRQNRPVKPNLGFMVQLLTLERKLKEQGINLQ